MNRREIGMASPITATIKCVSWRCHTLRVLEFMLNMHRRKQQLPDSATPATHSAAFEDHGRQPHFLTDFMHGGSLLCILRVKYQN